MIRVYQSVTNATNAHTMHNARAASYSILMTCFITPHNVHYSHIGGAVRCINISASNHFCG